MRIKLDEISMGFAWTCEPLSELKPNSELCSLEERLRCERQKPPFCTKVLATVLHKESDEELARLALKGVDEVFKARVLAEGQPAYGRCQEIQIVAGEVFETPQDGEYKKVHEVEDES